MQKELISPQDVVKAFPADKTLVRVAEYMASRTVIKSAAEFIALVQAGKISPKTAVESYPEDVGIVEAAYRIDASSIAYADEQVIKHLGQQKIIKMEDVVNYLHKTMPSEEQMQKKPQRLLLKQRNKKIGLSSQGYVLYIGLKGHLLQVKKRLVVNCYKTSQWMELFAFHKAMTDKAAEALIAGPLPKTEETYQLEDLARAMLHHEDFTIKTIGTDDYFIFADGQEFNWTKIRKNAVLQHIQFQRV